VNGTEASMIESEVAVGQVSEPDRPRSAPAHHSFNRVLRATLTEVVCICIAVGIFAAPVLYFFMQSFKDLSDFARHPTSLPDPFVLKNYADAWNTGGFGHQYINSLLYATIPTIITLILGVFLAFPIARGYVPFSRFWYVFFIFNGFLPLALIPLFTVTRFLHLYNNLPGYLTLLSVQGAGFFFFVGYLKTVPREREEAAALDGCGYVRFVFTILIPEMKPALASFAIFGFVEQWNNFILPIVLLPDPALWPTSRGLYTFFGAYTTNWPLVVAATVIVATPMVVVFILLQKYLVQGVSGGAAGVGMDDV
jgi:raffinose/stachyose/melibiose transport system permease protein